jgi:hypothetical protein
MQNWLLSLMRLGAGWQSMGRFSVEGQSLFLEKTIVLPGKAAAAGFNLTTVVVGRCNVARSSAVAGNS